MQSRSVWGVSSLSSESDAVYIAGMILARGVIGWALMTAVLATGCMQKAEDGPDGGVMGAAGSGGTSGPNLNNRSFILDSSEGFTPVMDTTVRVFFQDR